ncbi:uncharacterized protein LOC132749018 [Ruditapes philippinarum]|uniref:uncharacterized protein LOC132749018 n=1 Tax=Ruditapes philippinarum TaxID=129788 RepID=UPI00295A826B|nr:uncharacterized protein LOC132749018 [Ruditapes philippinarum]
MGNSARKTKENTGCGNCSEIRRVLNVSELQIGQHICEPGRKKCTYKENRHSLKAQYFHHAIIGEIKHRNDYKVRLVLIHYANVIGLKQGSIKITEEERDLKHDEIYIVKYTYPKYSPREIVQRAKKETKREVKHETNYEQEEHRYTFGNYNLFVSNCEHFATWCVLGNKESFQIDQKWRVFLFPLKISSGMAGILSQLLLEILRFFASFVSDKNLYGPGFSLLVIGAFYSLVLFGRYRNLENKYRNYRRLCQHCHEEKWSILKIKFFWFILSGILFYFITDACTPWFPAWPVTIILHVIFIFLSIFFRWLYQGLKSPFMHSTRVRQLSDIKRGHVITFRHFGFQHFALITKIHSETSEISIIHYKGFFNIKLTKDKICWSENSIWRQRLTKLPKYKAKQRISRIKRRLGERKWHWRCNRSDHVCYWASIKQKHWEYYPPVHNKETLDQTEEDYVKKSSLEVETIVVNLRTEIEEGDVIEYYINSRKKEHGTGIITELKNAHESKNDNDRIFTIVLVIQKHRNAEEAEITVDLNTDTIKVKKFHPVHCRSMQERKKQAKKAQENIEQHKKFNIMKFCVLKEKQTKEQKHFERKKND